MKKILVPIDGSEYSKLAMAKAKEIAGAFGSTVVLIHVNDFHEHTFNYNMELDESFYEKFDQISKDILAEGKRYFSELGDKVETVQMEGPIANTIVEYANSNGFDLIVMGSHGWGAFQSFLMGGVTQKVSHQSKISVLIAK